MAQCQDGRSTRDESLSFFFFSYERTKTTARAMDQPSEKKPQSHQNVIIKIFLSFFLKNYSYHIYFRPKKENVYLGENVIDVFHDRSNLFGSEKESSVIS